MHAGSSFLADVLVHIKGQINKLKKYFFPVDATYITECHDATLLLIRQNIT